MHNPYIPYIIKYERYLTYTFISYITKGVKSLFKSVDGLFKKRYIIVG